MRAFDLKSGPSVRPFVDHSCQYDVTENEIISGRDQDGVTGRRLFVFDDADVPEGYRGQTALWCAKSKPVTISDYL